MKSSSISDYISNLSATHSLLNKIDKNFFQTSTSLTVQLQVQLPLANGQQHAHLRNHSIDMGGGETTIFHENKELALKAIC